MTTSVALLRAVNVAGTVVAMADLRAVLEALGFGEVRSLLASGNLIFRSDIRTAELEGILETEFQKRLNLRTDVCVRSARDCKALVDRNPFGDEAREDPAHLVVSFLKDTPAPKNLTLLEKAIVGPERIALNGKQLYIVYPAGIGRSRLTSALMDAKLGTHGTGRNWNTVLKILALTGG